MRLSLPALALMPLLGACAAPAPGPAPVAVEVIRAVLVAHLDDGRRCVALTPFDAGQGTFGNCPGLGWRVVADAAANPLRQVVEGGFALIGAPAALQPMVLVEVTAADGRVRGFVLPPAGGLR